MFTAVASVSSSLKLSQMIAGHRSVHKTQRYTQAIAIGDTLKLKSKLSIPGLADHFGKYFGV